MSVMVFRGGLEKVVDRGADEEEGEEGEIVQGEAADVVTAAAGVVLYVFPEGDEAGQGGDQGAYTADVDTDEQIGIVTGELRQEDGRGDIADALTGQGAEQEGVPS